jgi:hypothetical protein
LLLVLILLASLAGPVLAASLNTQQGRELPVLLASVVVGMTVFLTPTIAYDFRGDVDRMDMLKALPVAPAPIVVGQLVTPVMLIGGIQWLALAVIAVVTRRAEPLFGATAALVLPFNFLLIGIENLLFLWFPTRLGASTPGDFQALGRQLLLMLAKVTGLTIACGSATLAGTLAFLLAGQSWLAALAAGWATLTAFAVGLVPLIALAFRQYDVARDTPP